jgi:hypothetical protein
MYEIFNSFEIIVLFSTTLTAFAKVIILDSVYLYNVLTSSSIPNIDCNLYLWGLWFSWSGIKSGLKTFFIRLLIKSFFFFFGYDTNPKKPKPPVTPTTPGSRVTEATTGDTPTIQQKDITDEKEKDIINTPANIVTQVVASLPNLEVAPANIQQPLQTLENSVDLSFSDLELEAIGVPVAGSLPNLEVAPANIQQPLQDITVTHEKEKDIINTPANIVTQVVASLPNLEVAPTNIQQPLQTLENSVDLSFSDLELESIKDRKFDLLRNTLYYYKEQLRQDCNIFEKILISQDKSSVKTELRAFIKLYLNFGYKSEIQTFLTEHMLNKLNMFILDNAVLNEGNENTVILYKVQELKNDFALCVIVKKFYNDLQFICHDNDIPIETFDPLGNVFLGYLKAQILMNCDFLEDVSKSARIISSFMLLTENTKNLFTNILTEEGIEPATARANITTCIANYSRYLDDNLEKSIDPVFIMASLNNLAVVNFKTFYQDYNIFVDTLKKTDYKAELLLTQDFFEKLSLLYLIKEYPKIKLADLSNEMQGKLLEAFELASIRLDHKYDINTTSLIKNKSYQLSLLVMLQFQKIINERKNDPLLVNSEETEDLEDLEYNIQTEIENFMRRRLSMNVTERINVDQDMSRYIVYGRSCETISEVTGTFTSSDTFD